jgi:hypothetical protein
MGRRSRCALWLRVISRRRVLIAIVCLTAFAFGVLSLEGGDAVQAAAGPAALPAYFSLTSGGVAVPRSFFGISMEYDQMPVYADEGPVFDQALALIRPQDGTRLLLRIGGRSTDHTYWETPRPKNPKHLIEVGQQWLDQLGALVRRDGLRVMLDLNLAVHSPTLEASFAQAAIKALPPRRLAGLEIGNEPDLYWRQPWLSEGRIASTIAATPKHWAVNYSASDYRRDYVSYARTLVAKLPGIPLGGPAIISNSPPWLSSVEGLGRLDPGFISIHRYASSNCWPTNSPWWPTIPLILNETSSAGLAASVRSAVTFAHSRHQALRLTEVNSISCGGNVGVANTFATALWAPDTLFEMIRAGVDSVSWHIRPNQPNAPWEPTRRGIEPMPELYGLAIFAQMMRPGAEVLNSTSSSALHVKGWAVRTPQGLRVLLINKGARAADVNLRLGTGSRPAFVRRLLAPGVGAQNGIRFGAQWIGSDARWHGRLVAATIHGSGGAYRIGLPGYRAALVSVWR